MNAGPTFPERPDSPSESDIDHDATCGHPDSECSCYPAGEAEQVAWFRAMYLNADTNYRGIAGALNNLLLGLNARADMHLSAGNALAADEISMVAETLRAVLDNPTASLSR